MVMKLVERIMELALRKQRMSAEEVARWARILEGARAP